MNTHHLEISSNSNCNASYRVQCSFFILASSALQHACLITLDVIIALRYYLTMIKTFADKEAEKIFNRQRSRKLPESIQRKGRMKLEILDAADAVEDLRIPPGNRLEKLSGDREGQHSIRINQQWRICFRWKNGDAYDVEIVDYH